MRSLVSVGVPVYKGQDLAQTLTCIQSQSYKNLEVIVSIEGDDDESWDLCRSFSADRRFNISKRDSQLGWAGNTNWIMEQSSGEFFCYFQQDDLADHAYIEKMLGRLASEIDASVCYSHLRWFGYTSNYVFEKPLVGTPIERLSRHIEQLGWVPMQGLIRMSAIKRVGMLRLTEFRSCLEELVWLAKLARIGHFVCVPQVLYMKRNHSGAEHRAWHSWPEAKRIDAWIVCLAGIAQVALRAADRPADKLYLLAAVLDRLLITREDRWMFVDTEAFGAQRLRDISDHFVARLKSEGWDVEREIGHNWEAVVDLVLEGKGPAM